MSELVKSAGEKTISSRWIQDGQDYILHLGVMQKAVVVARYVPSLHEVVSGKSSWYSISPRSIFPFGDGQQEKRFDNAADAVAFAEKIILNWLNSIMIDGNKKIK
jgi:hypothetical protein